MKLRILGMLALSCGVVKAALTLTVTPNAVNPSTHSDWTLSGSGLSGLATPGNTFALADLPDTIFGSIPDGQYDSTSGGFTIGVASATGTGVSISSNADDGVSFTTIDGIRLPFDAVIPAGTDLSTAGGTVTFPIPASSVPSVTLPSLSSGVPGLIDVSPYFGTVSIIPEISTLSLMGVPLFLLAIARRARRG